jgi:GNAT superfamily N-acetyltransferase
MTNTLPLDFHPLTSERWPDLETLFGPHGACGGCWCMWWRLARKAFDQQKGEGNRQALKALVDAGQTPGILGYVEGQAVAWCSLGPREVYASLERSRVLKRVDDQAVWSMVCFYIAKAFRGQGIMLPMIRAGIAYAQSQGATILEAYPTEPAKALPAAFAYMGLASTFRRAGFVEVARRSPTHPVMRYLIEG